MRHFPHDKGFAWGGVRFAEKGFTMKDPNYAPVYCALYPELASITRRHGYALAIHGSLGRDMDLICIPWAEMVSEPDAVLNEITSTFAIRLIGGPPTQKNHGRLAYTISVGHGECAIDMSFLPTTPAMKATKEQP